MRTFFLLSFILITSLSTFSQDDKPPSKAEIQTQMKQAISDAKKQRDELQKNIADAKAKNEDAESIKQMEDQVAMLDKMIGQLENTNPLGNLERKTLPVLKTTEPAFVSPFTPIPLKSAVAAPTWAEAKDQLLWFKGKKIDANTIICPDGTVARYDPKTHQLTIQPPGRDTIYHGLVRFLSQLQTKKKQFMSEIDKDPNAFFMFPEIDAARDQFDYAKDQYYDFAKNTEDISPPQIYTGLDYILFDIQKYMGSLSDDPDYPPLPKRTKDICACDPKEAAEMYKDELENWFGDFISDDRRLLDMIEWVYNDRETLTRRQGPRPDPPDFDRVTTEAKTLLLKRLRVKLEKLCKEYQQNIDAESPMVMSALALRKIFVKWIPNKDVVYSAEGRAALAQIEKAQNLVSSDIFKNYFDAQKASKNFVEVFNLSRCLVHEINRYEVESNYKVNFQQWKDLIDNFNRFTLSLKIDFEYQMVDEEGTGILMIATGALESDKINVSLGKEDCKLRLFIKDVDNGDRGTSGEEFKIPMKITSGMKDYTKDKYPAFNYTGPPLMGWLFPTFKLSFCGDKSEVQMEDLTYRASDIKKFEHADVATNYTIDMMGYANKMMIGIRKTQANAQQLIQTTLQGLNMGSTSNMTQFSGDPVYDKMKEEYEMNKKRLQLLYQAGQVGQTQHAIVDLGVINPQGSTTLINTHIDLADPNDPDRKAGIVLRHGYLTIELVHTPK